MCSLIGPSADEPITVNSMLDCGAHIVLINSMLADQLGLCWFCLHVPLPISIALNNSSTSDSHLHEYVKLAPYTPGSAWMSRAVKVIVTPGLCVPLLLGLPFLTVNHIVADFENRTAIDKDNAYDLLNPPPHKPNRKLIDTKRVIHQTKKAVKAMLPKLIEVCEQRLKEGKHVPEPIKPLNIAGIIKDCIEILVFQEKMNILESELLTEFKDVFAPLPHVNKLPRTVTAQIKLKNAKQTIKTRTYTCP